MSRLSENLNILWLSHRDINHPRAGGSERVIFEISKRLVQIGFKVIWASTQFPEARESITIDGVKIVRIGSYVSAHLWSPLLIRKLKPEVVIDDLGHVVPWCSERLASVPGTALFYHLHQRTLSGQAPPVLSVPLKWLERRYCWCYPNWPFVTISEQGVKDLLALGIPSKRISCIPLGVDLKRFRPFEKASEPTMIYFGGFRDYKRPWIPLEVHHMLRDRIPGLRLIMVGDGPSRARLERMISKSNIEGVTFLGRVLDHQLVELVSRAWVNLHCSVAEGWGLSIIEASAAGTPTVAFSVPGVRDSVIDMVNGIKVLDGDIPAFAEAVGEVLSNPDDWAGRSRARAELNTWENTALRWAEHLRIVREACSYPDRSARYL